MLINKCEQYVDKLPVEYHDIKQDLWGNDIFIIGIKHLDVRLGRFFVQVCIGDERVYNEWTNRDVSEIMSECWDKWITAMKFRAYVMYPSLSPNEKL